MMCIIDDGHYPRIKQYSEYNRDDIHKLITLNKLEEIEKVINAISIGMPTASSDFITYLAAVLHDKSVDLIAKLFFKI